MQEEYLKGLRETVGGADEVEAVRRAVAGHKWIFAKTYAAFCPHEYTLRKDWENDDEYRFLVNFIWRYGLEAYYGKKTVPNRYWFDHENGYYYFVFPDDTDEKGNATDKMILINRGRICEFDFWKDQNRGIIRCAWHRKSDLHD